MESEYGCVQLVPSDKVIAGSYGTWRIVYTVGSKGVVPGGGILVVQRWPSDWGAPQFDDPQGENYLTAITSNGATVVLKYDEFGYTHPWEKCLEITIIGKPLKESDALVVTYGDTSKGSPGARAQTFVETRHELRILVDIHGDGQFVTIDSPLSLQIVGGEADHLVVTAPSLVSIGEKFSITVQAKDKWGNPSYNYKGKIRFYPLDNVILPQEYEFSIDEHGVHKFDSLQIDKPGIYEIKVKDVDKDISAISNPIVCCAQKASDKLFWGDIHGQCLAGCGSGTLDEYFSYARDIADVDFCSNQGNCHLLSKKDIEDIREIVKKYHTPHEFITFFGYEWSDETERGGDHNVYFLDENSPVHRASHKYLEDKSDIEDDLSPVTKIYEVYRNTDTLIVPHVGGRTANLRYHDSSLEPVIEIYSSHGCFEWLLQDALSYGYKVGVIAGSDDVMARPGASKPGCHIARFVKGGLVGVYAQELTREEIWRALKEKRCYATTGERIILEVVADGHYVMGEEYTTTSQPEIAIRVIGTNFIEKIELIRKDKVIYTYPLVDYTSYAANKIKVAWGGAKKKDTGLFSHVVWDGNIRVDKAEIISVKSFGFDSPREKIYDLTHNSFKWVSSTSGDSEGVIIELDTITKDTSMSFNSPQVNFNIWLSNFMNCTSPQIIDIGPINRHVVIDKVYSLQKTKNVEFKIVDREILPGVNPYYVKVTQVDGNIAWSSPIYINFK